MSNTLQWIWNRTARIIDGSDISQLNVRFSNRQHTSFRVYDTSFVDLLGFADIEDITHKTGNFKRFSVLVKMLTAALAQQSDSVFIDLLTFADLVSSRIMKAFAFRCLHIAFSF